MFFLLIEKGLHRNCVHYEVVEHSTDKKYLYNLLSTFLAEDELSLPAALSGIIHDYDEAGSSNYRRRGVGDARAPGRVVICSLLIPLPALSSFRCASTKREEKKTNLVQSM